jgi:hypothetical protein
MACTERCMAHQGPPATSSFAYSAAMRCTLFAAFLSLAACATSSQQGPKTAQSGSGSDDDQQCHEVTDTGSMFSHTECTSKQDRKEQHDDAERYLQRSSQGATNHK